MVEVRKWVVLIFALNTIYQTMALTFIGESTTDRELYVQIFYWAIWLINLCIIITSYKKDIRAIYYALVLISYRMALPLLDLDGNDEIMTRNNATLMMINQNLLCFANLIAINNLTEQWRFLVLMPLFII